MVTVKRPLGRVSVRSVGDVGIRLVAAVDRPLDVLFDGRRVWSFWSQRDTSEGRLLHRFVAWPDPLVGALSGYTRLCVREHVSGRVLLDQEVHLGAGSDRIRIVGRSGALAGLDKSGRLTSTFESRTEDDVRPLLDAISTVLGLLDDLGVQPFLAYGTLLGAVREGRFLGHDSDADLAYVSAASVPVDVVAESFRLQRAVGQRGFATFRYSGAAFRIDVEEGGGVLRGLDVFAGFMNDRRLYLMGEVAADFEPAWIYPRTTCTLEGRSFPVPALPDHLLEAMYGPSWRVPDPAFKFDTSERARRQLNGWFRGTAAHQSAWQRTFSGLRHQLPARRPSGLARRVHRDVGAAGVVVDVGAGRGGDALWLARRGVRVTALDFAPAGMQAVSRRARERGWPLETRYLNLGDRRGTLVEGAALAHQPGPRAVVARHVADATNDFGRESLVRLASMALREGGRLYLEVWTGEGWAPRKLSPVSLHALTRLLRDHGATVLEAAELSGKPGVGRRYSVGRVVAEWTNTPNARG